MSQFFAFSYLSAPEGDSHRQVTRVRMVGNLGNQVQQRAQTDAEGAKYDPDYTGNFQRPRPPGLASDFSRPEFGIVNAVAEEITMPNANQ